MNFKMLLVAVAALNFLVCFVIEVRQYHNRQVLPFALLTSDNLI